MIQKISLKNHAITSFKNNNRELPNTKNDAKNNIKNLDIPKLKQDNIEEEKFMKDFKMPPITTHGVIPAFDKIYGTASKERQEEIEKRQREYDLEEAKQHVYPKKYYQNIHFSDLAGINDEIEKIKETIEIPIKYADFVKKHNFKVNRNILLYGPPGGGKSTLAKAIANETNCNLFLINGAEMGRKYEGETERELREIFKAAELLKPSIIFIDEADSLAMQRDTTDNARLSNGPTNQLLTLIDNLKSHDSNVFVIAATNFPEFLDKAFIRKGRMDMHINLPLPNLKAIEEIFKVKTKTLPIAKNLDRKKIIKNFEKIKMSGADIEAVVYEATISALKRNSLSNQKDEKVELTQEDFEKSVKAIQASKKAL